MKTFISMFLAIFVMFTPSFSSQCLSEKDVNVEEVKKILEPVLGGAKVISVKKSPVKNVFEVIIEAKDRRVPIYIDCTLNFLITGEIIDLKEKKSITRERAKQLAEELSQKKMKQLEKALGPERAKKLKEALGERFADVRIIDPTIIPKKYLFAYGNPTAKMTVYVVTDPECPFCARFDTEMKKVLKNRNDVKFEIVLFPMPFHRQAPKISQRIICEKSVEEKKEILEEAFEAVKEKNIEKLKKIGKECEEGKKALKEHSVFISKTGIKGTPTLIFPYGVVIPGWMSSEQMNKVLDALK